MAIDPTKSGVNPLAGPRVDQTGANQSSRHSGQVKPAGSGSEREVRDQDDSVRLSAEAREAAGAEGTTSRSGLSKDRLQEVLTRLTSGYYDSPQVVDKVARRVHEELKAPGATD
jgi:hypothetical protein